MNTKPHSFQKLKNPIYHLNPTQNKKYRQNIFIKK